MLNSIKAARRAHQPEGKPDATGKPSPMRYFPLVFLPIVFTIAGLVFIPRMLAERREQQLLATGSQATAQIVTITETGNLYNREPEVVIALTIHPPTGESFEVEVTKVLAKTELAKYVVGAVFDVRYDPAEPGEVAFVGLATSTGSAK